MKILGKILIVLGIAALIGVIGWRVANKVKQGQTKPRSVIFSVGTGTLKKEIVERRYTFNGIAEGDPQVKVYPMIAGKFQYNAVAEGERVSAGQGLVYITRDSVGENFQPSPVLSPIGGVVKKLYYNDRGAAATMDRPVAEVANLESLKVVVNVGEAELVRIRAGMSARIESSVNSNLALEGSVFSVTPFVDSDSLSGSFIVKARNYGYKMPAGMSVQVSLRGDKFPAYMVPQKAILMGLDYPYIYVVTEGKARAVPVTLGYVQGDRVEVKGELTDGMEIILDGAFRLFDGAKIQVVKEGGAKPGGSNQQGIRDGSKPGNTNQPGAGAEKKGPWKKAGN